MTTPATPFEETEMAKTLRDLFTQQYGEVAAELMLKGVRPEALVHVLPAEDHK